MEKQLKAVEQPELGWLENPEIFCVNRIEAHSDHLFFESEAAYLTGETGLRQFLNGTWNFAYAPSPSLRQADFHQESYDISSFDTIEVPGHIQLQGYDTCHYVNTMYPWDGHKELRPPNIDWDNNPVGSYVTEFDLKDDWDQKQVFISFQGVETAFYVWLNGSFVGYGEDSFTPTEFELTPYVKKNGNRLAVEVYKRSSASWLEDQDFFRFSGIFRDVYLYAVPQVHVRDIFITADLDHDYDTGILKAEIDLTGIVEDHYLDAVLTDEQGRTVCEFAPVPCSRQLVLETKIPHVIPWNGEKPYRYTLVITIRKKPEGGTSVVEIVPQKIGFRRFEMLDHVMCLNGKRLVFQGINRHEFHNRRGRCISKEDMLWDIRFMKQYHINAVRTSHYPNDSYWYDLCDEYGIYLVDEANLESHGSWQKMGACDPSWNVPGSLPEWKAAVLDRAISMLERDKNHPSVLIWSCGNESYAGADILAMSQFFRQRDPSRLVHYEGVFWNREFESASDMESRMYAKPAEVEAYLNNHPQKPFILCEYMHAMGNSLGGMHKYTDLEDQYPLYQGGFIWDYIDQAILGRDGSGREVLRYGGDFGDRPTDYQFCGNGVVYSDRTISPKAQEMRYLYQFLELKPEQGGVHIRNKQLFTDTEDYFFVFTVLHNGISLWEKTFFATVEAMSQQWVNVDMPLFEQPGEYAYQVYARLKDRTLWADEHTEVAFGETVVSREPATQQKLETGHTQTIQVIHGDVNLGVKGEGFHVIFSRQEGGIVALRYGEKEWITRPPMPVFWRASTDNDRGNKFHVDSAVWLGAGMFPGYRKTDVEVTEEENEVCVRYTYCLSTVPQTETQVTYRVTPDGKIHVNAHFFGKQGLPELPLFGMRFRFLESADRFTWYGNGPDENYCDRKAGARLGIYEQSPRDNVSRYLVPQECGNRTGVRWLEVRDRNGGGLRFTGTSQPFEMSVLPYTAEELESALHPEELPASSYTIVNILAKQRGVGGDDSWGAPVYPEYCIRGSEDMEFSFEIEGIYE